jgi:hypothetical protein
VGANVGAQGAELSDVFAMLEGVLVSGLRAPFARALWRVWDAGGASSPWPAPQFPPILNSNRLFLDQRIESIL